MNSICSLCIYIHRQSQVAVSATEFTAKVFSEADARCVAATAALRNDITIYDENEES
jgi:hypothetical protein